MHPAEFVILAHNLSAEMCRRNGRSPASCPQVAVCCYRVCSLHRVEETPYAQIQERRFIRPAQCACGVATIGLGARQFPQVAAPMPSVLRNYPHP